MGPGGRSHGSKPRGASYTAGGDGQDAVDPRSPAALGSRRAGDGAGTARLGGVRTALRTRDRCHRTRSDPERGSRNPTNHTRGGIRRSASGNPARSSPVQLRRPGFPASRFPVPCPPPGARPNPQPPASAQAALAAQSPALVMSSRLRWRPLPRAHRGVLGAPDTEGDAAKANACDVARPRRDPRTNQ